MKPDYQPNPYTARRPRRGLALVAAVALIIVIAMAWGTQRTARGGDPARRATGESPAAAPEGVGTTGAMQTFATLPGSGGGHELVGRRLELQITAHDIANDVAFWVGEGDNRILAVTARDTRDERQRQTGEPSAHSLPPVRAGQRVLIAGTVQRLPHAEAMHSWGLSNMDVAALRERGVYLHVDQVTPAAAP